ncbi:hypothetical protein QJQ45_012836 [Haematococcus lacustris]|nr:hypothetical protein QJQ45_012836 [Haematococcus lacustris]
MRLQRWPSSGMWLAVTLATWDAVWEEYLHPKWTDQKLRLYGAQEKVLERYFKKARVPMACCKVVKRPNSGRPTDRLPCKVVTVDEFRISRVSSAMNSPQPCEEELDRSKPTGPEGQVQERLLRSAWSKRFKAPVRSLMWYPWLDQATPGDIGRWVDRDSNAAFNFQCIGEAKWRPLEPRWWKHRPKAPAKGKVYPALGFKKLRHQAPKAQAQQPVAQ